MSQAIFTGEAEDLPDDVKALLDSKNRDSIPSKRKKGQLGVIIEDHPNGVFLIDVNKDSAAAKGGLIKTDIIKTVDGIEIKTKGDLISLISAHKPNDTVEITYLRAGRDKSIRTTQVTLQEAVENFPIKSWDEVVKPPTRK